MDEACVHCHPSLPLSCWRGDWRGYCGVGGASVAWEAQRFDEGRVNVSKETKSGKLNGEKKKMAGRLLFLFCQRLSPFPQLLDDLREREKNSQHQHHHDPHPIWTKDRSIGDVKKQ